MCNDQKSLCQQVALWLQAHFLPAVWTVPLKCLLCRSKNGLFWVHFQHEGATAPVGQKCPLAFCSNNSSVSTKCRCIAWGNKSAAVLFVTYSSSSYIYIPIIFQQWNNSFGLSNFKNVKNGDVLLIKQNTFQKRNHALRKKCKHQTLAFPSLSLHIETY